MPPKLGALFASPDALERSNGVIEVSGNKAILEDQAEGTTKNGERFMTRSVRSSPCAGGQATQGLTDPSDPPYPCQAVHRV